MGFSVSNAIPQPHVIPHISHNFCADPCLKETRASIGALVFMQLGGSRSEGRPVSDRSGCSVMFDGTVNHVTFLEFADEI
jgi:hypothetical protein